MMGSLKGRPAGAIGAAVVIRDDDGRVLLVHHIYGRRNWELPGGGSEAGESAAQTAVREAREELGASVVLERLVGVYWEPTRGDGVGMHHFVFTASLADPPPTGPADLAEISEIAWFGVCGLPRPISDFTVRRITDAIGDAPARLAEIAERRWIE